jgi:myo-inositol 2-dehydrogenase/D-chiro-inositol 1-dehydrogenase
MTINLGIIGAGRIGKVHAENIVLRVPGARVLAVADVNIAAAQELAARLGITHVSPTYHDILNNPEVHAVAICSATDTHAPIMIEAAACGKHIFCEKPIALELDKIDDALAAVERAGVKLQVGFNRRFDPNFARVRAAVQNGEIGEPHLLHIVSRDPAPPPIAYVSVSGGIFLDMTIHDFDMARFLVGSEIVEVYTAAANRVDPAIGAAGDLDTVVVLLTFANGVIGTIDNSRKAVYGYDQRAEVFGSGGAISTGNLYPNQAIISTADHIRRDLPLNFFMERYTESYRVEMQAFIDAINHNTPIPATGEDGRLAVVIGMAARKSYDEHRPVRIDEIA